MNLDYSHSFLTLNIDNISFLITKAHIKESLESLFSIECEGYIESLQEHPFKLDSFDSIRNNSQVTSNINNPSSILNFHPNTLINKQAILKIEKPYSLSLENNTLIFNETSSTFASSNTNTSLKVNKEQGAKEYKGILSFVKYLGLNPQSSANILNKKEESKVLNHKHFFTFTLTSPLIRMSLNKANRIYTNKTILEAIQITLDFYKEYLDKALDFSHLHLGYPKLELITQYEESDLDFITRLAHNHGIYFYEDSHSIYFNDFSQKENTRSILFNPKSNNTLNEPCISSFYKQQALMANQFTQSSQDVLNPFTLKSLSLNSNLDLQKDNEESCFMYNEHNYLSESSFTQSIDLKTPLSLKEKRAQTLHNCFQAQSNIYDLSLNQYIDIDFSQSIKENKENLKDFYIIAIEHILINEALLANNFNSNDEVIKKENVFTKNNLKNETNRALNNAETTQDGNTLASLDTSSLNSAKAYSNLLTILPTTFSYAPSLKQKPKAPNSTLGVVIGEDENIEKQRNTIHTDEYGRVKVRINCFANQEVIDNNATHKRIQQDTQGNANAINNSHDTENNTQTKAYYYHYSPYLRVSSPIASYSSGFYHTPRIGDEVIISFLDDNIDRPYVSGSIYNQRNPALPHLPLASHQTSLSARTLNEDSDNMEQGLNEITLSNLKDKEQLYIQAQKDYKELIKHNFSQKILNNKDSKVDGNYNESITKTHKQEILGLKDVRVGAEYITNVALSKDTIVGGSHTINVGANNKLRVANSSSEYVGGDKEIEIGGNLNYNIKQDIFQNILGHLNIKSREEINIFSQSQVNINAKENILLTSKQSLSMEMQEYLVAQAKNAIIEVLESLDFNSKIINLDSKENIKIKVGAAEIEIKENTITLTQNGNTITINDNGINIRGKKINISKGD